MEIIIALIVFVAAGYFIFFRKKEEIVADAPYKVETPVTQPTSDFEQRMWEKSVAKVVDDQPKVEVQPVAAADVVITTEAPAKKARKPRAPKVGETAAKSAKAADKKAVAPKKATAMKATKKSKKA